MRRQRLHRLLLVETLMNIGLLGVLIYVSGFGSIVFFVPLDIDSSLKDTIQPAGRDCNHPTSDHLRASAETNGEHTLLPSQRTYVREDSKILSGKHLERLRPDAALEKYKRQHAYSAWMDGHDFWQREFAVVEIDCIHQQPSIWSHAVMNSLIFSIATNRTLIFRYVGASKSCKETIFPDHWVSSLANVERHAMVKPVQLYFDYNSDDEVIPAGDYSHSYELIPWTRDEPLKSNVVLFPSITRNVERTLPEFSFVDTVHIEELFLFGRDYMYGMLWNNLFHFGREVLRDIPALPDKSAVIAMQFDENDRDLERFQSCVSKLVNSSQPSCLIIPIANRQGILEAKKWLSQHFSECQVLVAADDESRESPTADWFRQLVLARQAAQVSLAPHSGLTGALLRSIFSYHRARDVILKDQRAPPLLRSVPTC